MSTPDDADQRASSEFSDQLRAMARSTTVSGDQGGDPNAFTEALAAHAQAQRYGTEAEIAQARAKVEALLNPATPAPDFGAGARRSLPASEQDMSKRIRAARNGWT